MRPLLITLCRTRDIIRRTLELQVHQDHIILALIISGINEVKVRGARTITIGEEDTRLHANEDNLVVIPKLDAQLSSLLGVLPLQLLSCHMSVLREFDHDFPRNLSKTLTVE